MFTIFDVKKGLFVPIRWDLETFQNSKVSHHDVKTLTAIGQSQQLIDSQMAHNCLRDKQLFAASSLLSATLFLLLFILFLLNVSNSVAHDKLLERPSLHLHNPEVTVHRN